MLNPSAFPLSVIICVHDDWKPLESCLKSLSRQRQAPIFEVVVVDDGSADSLPDVITRWSFDYPIRLIRQTHSGLAVARNTGMQNATGAVFLFTDCDCILDEKCLYELGQSLNQHPNDNCFQLWLSGDSSHVVGKVEELHLSVIRSYSLLRDGHIRYLNTAGAALRRRRIAKGAQVFDPCALRAQDTLLLADLIRAGELPRLVTRASVVHDVRLSIPRYIWKGFWTGYVEGKTYGIINSLGISVRATWFGRLRMLISMARESISNSVGLCPLFIAVIRQGLTYLGSVLYEWRNPKSVDIPFRSGLERTGS
jgi:glycosyltransferase involved in cell wall biosynthesis